MVKIFIPDNFVPERTYIFDIIFEDFLGIDYLLTINELSEEYRIVIDNDKEIIIKDYFFSKIKSPDDYLKNDIVPRKINYSNNQFSIEKDLPIIFGEDIIEIKEDKIISHIDFFASAFFMLTSLEEISSTNKDKHERFICENSLAQKFNFHFRPIVNEYVECIWNMLVFLGSKQRRRKFNYNPKITHDIDFIARYDTFSKYTRAVFGDIFRHKSIKKSFKTTQKYINVKKGVEEDNFDTFNFLMDKSEEKNLKSHFYFIPGLIGEKDVKYNITDIKVEKIIRNIIKRGHKIGLHASYQSYNNIEIFREEKKRLENIYPQITEGRQHFLRFDNPKTWQIWNDCNMLIDSTMSYSNDGGFRCGTCYEFNVFNLFTRKKLNLKEQPLIAMDSALRNKYKTPQKVFEIFIELLNTTKKYKGNFVFLWHNSNFNVAEWLGFQEIYEEIINQL